MRKKWSAFILVAVVLVSCSRWQNHRLIGEADRIMQTEPERALLLLDSLHSFTHLSRKDKNKARFVRAFADFNLRNEVVMGWGMERTARYFAGKNDLFRASWAYFFAGRAAFDREDYKKASIYLSEAYDIAQNIPDSNLLVNVYYTKGELYLNQHDRSAALESYQAALAYRNQQQQQGTIPQEIANCYLILGNYPKAMEYYRMAEREVMERNDPVRMVDLLVCISQSCLQLGDHAQALTYAQRSLEYAPDAWRNFCLLAMAETWLPFDRDSVSACLQRVMIDTVQNLEVRQEYFRVRARLEEDSKNYREALRYYKLFVEYEDSLQLKNTDERIDHIVAQHRMKKWMGKNIRLERQRQMLVAGILFLGLILACIFLYFRYAIQKRRREYTDACRLIETLQMLQTEEHTSRDRFRRLLLEKLEISKKLAFLSVQPIEKNKAFLEMYHHLIDEKAVELDWTELYLTLNYVYDDFQKKLVSAFPAFTDKEVQLLCLMKAGFKSDEIAFIFHVTVYSIQKWRTAIRKKLDLDERQGIVEYISSRL